MVMRFLPNKLITQTSYAGGMQWLYEFMNFMRTPSPVGPGWTVPRSSNGTVGGAGDNITSYTSLSQYVSSSQRSWFVLQAPDGVRELLWWRFDTYDSRWYLYYSPSAGFTGGDAWNIPTATDTKNLHSGWAITQESSYQIMFHMGADDEAPYGFWCHGNRAGSPATDEGGYAMIPMTTPAVGDVDPMVFYSSLKDGFEEYLWYRLTSTTVGHCVAMKPGATGTYTCPALYMISEGQAVPNNMNKDANGADLSFPILFARPSTLGNGFYKGLSNFMQWNGTTRVPGEMFAARTRVSIGWVNVPWDGASDWLSS
jgi:hypothetical protein